VVGKRGGRERGGGGGGGKGGEGERWESGGAEGRMGCEWGWRGGREG